MKKYGVIATGVLAKNVRGTVGIDASAGDVTLTDAQAQNSVVLITGAAVPTDIFWPVGSVTPAAVSVINSGSAAITCQYVDGAGAGVVIPAGSGGMICPIAIYGAMADLLGGFARV